MGFGALGGRGTVPAHPVEGICQQPEVSQHAHESAGGDPRDPRRSLLSDTRKIKVIVHEDQQWADETWFPLVAAAGLRRFAAVTAEAGLGKLTVEEVFDAVHLKGLEVRKFSTVAAGRKWLAEI